MLRNYLPFLLLLAVAPAADEPPAPNRKANTIVLEATAIQNIGLEAVEAEEQDFEETALVLGTIEVLPGKRAVVSTRIPGRAKTVIGKQDLQCEAGDELLWVESRQPGDPPPVIRVDAPIAGIIARVNVAEGQPVEPSQSLMEIYDLSVVEAHAAVPQHLAGRIGKGMEAHIRVPGWPDRVWTAEMAHVGADADPVSGTVEAAFHVPNEDDVLRPGMRAEFTLVLAKTPGVQAIPREALQGDAANRYVFIRDYELKHGFVKTPVVTGLTNDRYVEIKEGLLPGDEVVVKGAYALAYAGQGSISLKEALDAAHGHPHNEDGTEMTKEQIAAQSGGSVGAAHDHGHDHGGDLIWKITSGVLLVLLIISSLRRKPGDQTPKPEAA
jgi:cobalt-zinc-cadmium efflux system membrane fusion protein